MGVGTSSADDELVGALGAEFGQRTEKKPRRDSKQRKQDPERASLRWNRLVLAVHQRLQSVTSAIHLMDREADIYELLSAMHQAGVRFIVRAKADRVCVGPDGERAHLFPTLDQATGQLTRQVPLSGRKAPWSPKDARRHPARESRPATLSTAAISVTVFKPQSSQDAGLPPSLQLNYVHVWEEHPPEGEAAVDWKLVTEEPCTTPEQIEAVVDGYRKRWRIEEFNKGLKTGCGIEKTQLETQSSVLSHVALAIPMAWRMLRLRNLERQRPNDPATEALSPVELEVLIKMAKPPLDPVPTAAQVGERLDALGVAEGGVGQVLVLGLLLLIEGDEAVLQLRRHVEDVLVVGLFELEANAAIEADEIGGLMKDLHRVGEDGPLGAAGGDAHRVDSSLIGRRHVASQEAR